MKWLFTLLFALLACALSSHERKSSFPHLTGDTWRLFADWRLTDVENFDPEYVERGDILFVEYNELKKFKYKYLKKIKHPFILLTPNSENGSDSPLPGFYRSLLKSDKIVAWFVQNIDCPSSERLIPIFIGLSNSFWARGQVPFSPHQNTEREIFAYLNFSVETNIEARSQCLNYFVQSWAHRAEPKDFTSYLHDLARSVFVVSPRGNGLDCHRTWEALLMGCYPIVLSSTLDPLYEDLPVVVVKNWEEVTEEFLKIKQQEFQSRSWNFEKLYAPYWLTKVKDLQKQIRSQRRPFKEWVLDTFSPGKGKYLIQESLLGKIDPKTLTAKLKATPPQWMKEQIEEDFRGIANIPKESVDATFSHIQKNPSCLSMIIRYRISSGELYRYHSHRDPVSRQDNSTELAIKTLLQCTEIPDIDFLVSYFDGIDPDFLLSLVPSDPSLVAPILTSAKIKNTSYLPLIPDWRSIGHWWCQNVKEVLKRKIPWEQKREMAFWRGGLTKEHRIQLCLLSKRHPDALDAKLNEDKPHLREQGIVGSYVSWDEFLSYKYLPYMDGVMCAAPALQWRLLSHSVIFKPESDEIQWFYRALKPYIHYIPVKHDLSDFLEKLDWAKNHDLECRQIVDRAYEFAWNNILPADVLCYFSLVLKHYASLQQLPNNPPSDPRWVKIQTRSNLKEFPNLTLNPAPF